MKEMEGKQQESLQKGKEKGDGEKDGSDSEKQASDTAARLIVPSGAGGAVEAVYPNRRGERKERDDPPQREPETVWNACFALKGDDFLLPHNKARQRETAKGEQDVFENLHFMPEAENC